MKEITISGTGGDEDVLPKFLPFGGSTSPLERCGGTMLPKSHHILLTPSHNSRCRDSASGALEGGDRIFTNKVGEISIT